MGTSAKKNNTMENSFSLKSPPRAAPGIHLLSIGATTSDRSIGATTSDPRDDGFQGVRKSTATIVVLLKSSVCDGSLFLLKGERGDSRVRGNVL